MKKNAKFSRAISIVLICLIVYMVILLINLLINHFISYTFVDGDILHFAAFSLSLSIIVAVAFAIWLFKVIKKNKKQSSLKERFKNALLISLSTLTIFFLCIMVSEMSAANMNYVLDGSEPVEYTAVVEKRDYTNYRKSEDTCKLLVNIEGKHIWIEVDFSTYLAADANDMVTVKKYEGAFGKAYYSVEK